MAAIKNVLDAAALLAVLNNETGAATVNLAEVGAKLIDAGMDEKAAQTAVSILGIGEIVDFDESLSWEAARLRPLTKSLGLSLGDRACLALAVKLKVPAITADKQWAKISFCRVVLIR